MDERLWPWLIGFGVGVIYSNGVEWFIHRFVLHGLGRRRESFWSFHWHEHHQLARRHAMHDPHYETPPWSWNGQGKEMFALLLAVVVHVPLLPWVPGFVLGVWYSTVNYYIKHRHAHLDPEWARRKLPWHVDHHMARNQDANWCVTRPWFDWILGTRVPYVGTEEEAEDVARARKRAERHVAEVPVG